MTGFDTTPKPAFLLAMQNQKWNMAGAASELGDNSLGLGRGAARRVWFIHDPAKRIFEVLDDGVGMDAIGRIFQLGNTIGRTPGDIGLYGSGGTMAILWLASRVEVWTLRAGKISHDLVDWKKQIAQNAFPVVSDQWKKATIVNTPSELFELKHGTLIRLHLLRERTFYTHNVQRDIAANFAPAFRQGKELAWKTIGKNGGENTLADALPAFSNTEKTISFNITLDVAGDLLPVAGRIGLIDDLPQSKSAISIGFGPRTITKTRECYSSPDGTEKYIGTGVAGWLDLGEGWQPYLATTKDAINDQPAWDALMAHVFEQIKPLLKQVDSREFAAEFDDLAIQLEAALNGKSELEIATAATRQSNDSEPGTGEDSDGQGPSETAPVKPTDPADDDGSDAAKTANAISRIIITQVSDAELEGALCRAEVENNEFTVAVNRDHHVVQLAMHAKPINKMALNLMITREIAAEVTSDQKMMARMFGRGIREKIDALGERDRPRLVSRLLMDRVRESNRGAA